MELTQGIGSNGKRPLMIIQKCCQSVWTSTVVVLSLNTAAKTVLADTDIVQVKRKHGTLRPQKPLRFDRDGEVGGSESLYLTPTRYTVATRITLHKGGHLCEIF